MRLLTRRATRTGPVAGAASDAATWLVPVLTLSTFLTMLHAVALAPLLPDISTSLGARIGLLGQIPALAMLTAAGIGLVAGPIAERIGYHRALSVSLMVATVSAVGMAIAPGYVALLAAALLGSVARAVVQPVAVVIAAARLDGDAGRRAIGWIMAGQSGAVIAGIPALTTIAAVSSWRVALGAVAAMTALLVPLVMRGLGPSSPVAPAGVAAPGVLTAYRPLLHHYPTLALMLSTLIGNAAVWGAALYLGAFFSEHHRFSTGQIGWVYAVPGATLLLGSLLLGGRAGALPLRPLAMTARVVTGVTLAAVYVLPTSAGVGLVLLGIQGMATAVAIVGMVLMLMRDSPAGAAVTMTLNTAAMSLGSAMGNASGGFLLATGGFAQIGLFVLALSVGSALLIWSARAPSLNEPGGAAIW